mmetsp:Transcript_37355/g.33494  ORF Transcript_37355/g.33494 Transcript_37355/m.33494 type:complete len:320 (+) Transcript_37355:24-983(+)
MDTSQRRPSVSELLTDRYQLTMAYSYFKQGKHLDNAVFDAFFRKCPFKGEFAIFGGLGSLISFIQNFKISEEDIEFLRSDLGFPDPKFYEYLKGLDGSNLKIYAMNEGEVVFPNEPLVRLEGPLALIQIIETTVLNLLNFPTLIATNARRMKNVVGDDKQMIEFGLRRAQGPDGAMMASQYSYLGGFHGTSNVAAGKAYGVKTVGTLSHSYICSFDSYDDVKNRILDGKDFFEEALKIRKELGYQNTNDGEFAAFAAYAIDHPTNFVALVDTYDTVQSGVLNFVATSIALKNFGYEPKGVRLDSGDLAELSKTVRRIVD